MNSYYFSFPVLLAVATLSPAVSLAETITVDDDRKQCPSAQVSTIQDALAKANPGDEIQVCQGSYAASSSGLILDRPGIRLVAQAPLGSVKIVPGKGARGRVAAITVVADNVRVQGFEISGFSRRNRAAGILVGETSPASGVVISGNRIHHNDAGIRIGAGAADTEASGNEVRHNDRYGILVGSPGQPAASAGDARITYNDVHDNGQSSLTFDEGIGVSGVHGRVVVAFNKAYRNPVGLRVERSEGVLALKNDFSGNRLGVDLKAAHRNTFRHNRVSDNTGVGGIWVRRGSCANELAENEVERNRNDGIRVFDEQCVRNTLAGNRVKENSVHNVHVPSERPILAAENLAKERLESAR